MRFPTRYLLATVMVSLLNYGPIAEVWAQDPIALTWLNAAGSDAGVSVWYRCELPGGMIPAEQVHLRIAASTDYSVYVNGQRLLKFERPVVTSGVATGRVFDIRPLLREGRNLLAIELQGREKSGSVGVAVDVTRDQTQVVLPGGWKQAPAPPPVGWQQTVFNDRDWKGVEAVNSLPEGWSSVVFSEQASTVALGRKRRETLPLQWQDGDHVCIVGATFVERAQLSEHLEAVLTGTVGERTVTFRNLGWDADTIWSDSRGIFDAPAVGYMRMVEHIRAEEPTLVLICLGQNEALTAGLSSDNFSAQLMKLVDELEASGIPVVLLSPHELMSAHPPIPSPARFNSRVRVFAEATGSVAQSRQLAFVDLFSEFTDAVLAANNILNRLLEQQVAAADLTDNGMHFTSRGYACSALVLRERLLGIGAAIPEIRLDLQSGRAAATGVQLADVVVDRQAGIVSFRALQETLSPIPIRLLVSNGKLRGAGPDSAWGLRSPAAPGDSGYVLDSTNQYEALRQQITQKNELYFHRWRPQNITYLFGFRKHEQGNNAADIARFDPFIRESEQQIRRLQQPSWAKIQLQIAR